MLGGLPAKVTSKVPVIRAAPAVAITQAGISRHAPVVRHKIRAPSHIAATYCSTDFWRNRSGSPPASPRWPCATFATSHQTCRAGRRNHILQPAGESHPGRVPAVNPAVSRQAHASCISGRDRRRHPTAVVDRSGVLRPRDIAAPSSDRVAVRGHDDGFDLQGSRRSTERKATGFGEQPQRMRCLRRTV